MVAVPNAPLFNNDFPLKSTASIPTQAGRNRVKHTNNTQQVGGGKAQLETYTALLDVADYDPEQTPLTFPRDTSGNGGPAFART